MRQVSPRRSRMIPWYFIKGEQWERNGFNFICGKVENLLVATKSSVDCDDLWGRKKVGSGNRSCLITIVMSLHIAF